jgi:hypothetical protein
MKRDMWEFFENEKGELSMQRLLQFLAFMPATWLVLLIGTETALGVYLGAFVLNTAVNKAADVWGNRNARNTNRR